MSKKRLCSDNEGCNIEDGKTIKAIDVDIKPRTIWVGDNLPILRGLESGSVDMVYADPPFNSNRQYAAPIGSKAAGAMFRDTWTLNDIDKAWSGEIRGMMPAVSAIIETAGLSAGSGMQSYLTMMAVRLIEIRRILRSTGSMFLHCDNTAGAYLRVLCDAIFGVSQCRNEIRWKRTSAHSRARRFAPIHDTILLYSRSDGYKWNKIYQPYDVEYVERDYRRINENGDRYCTGDLTAAGLREGSSIPWRGVDPSAKGRHWAIPRTFPGAEQIPKGTREALDYMDSIGRIYWSDKGGTPRFIRYLSDMPGMPAQDVISDISPINSQAKERTGYPTQKPLALLRRFIEAATKPGDLVLDPFAGCATALVASEELGREWIGIDVSSVAVRLVKERMRDELGLFGFNVIERSDIPRRKGKRSRNIREILYGKQAGHCNLCNAHFELRNLTVDHIIPRAHGGPDDDANLQLLCGSCNSTKGTGTMTEAIAKLRQHGVIR